MRLLALDFDGVISDSAPESFVVAVRTYAELRPESEFAALAVQLGADRAPTIEAVKDTEIFAAFLGHMPLGNRSEDYAVILAAIEAGEPLPDQSAYDALRAAHDPSWLSAFHARFYGVRDALASGDPQGWQALMDPYPRLTDLLQRRADDTILAIATSKDRRSVRALLRAYEIDALFDDDRLLDKEAGVTKTAHLQQLRGRFDLRYEQMFFIDDKVNHLDAVAELGVRCGLAAWGYNGAREVQLARSRGYLVCSLEEIEAQLFGADRTG
jgi:phosphoglycolate phosphatase-like HAD superfamily hydrolase